jgi:CspA family cold shock protein
MERLTGYVKWFNNKTGYGFIRVIDSDEDIFVHHSGLSTALSYRYLVQGEYVEFEKGEAPIHSDKPTRVVALNVTGVKRGKLMCETRSENQPNRPAVPPAN